MRLFVRIAAAIAAAAVICGIPITVGTATAGASSLTYGSLPKATGKPVNGGTVSIAIPPGDSPVYIFPITPASDLSAYLVDQFQDYMWRPLWWSPKGDQPEIDYQQSIGSAPSFSNNNKTVTIHIKSGWKWNDGTPVTSTDVAFYIDLLKAAVAISPANDGDYTPGLFPDNLTSITTPNASTIVLTFNKTYNQNFLFLDQLGGLIPLPAQAWSKTSANGPIVDFTNPTNATAIYNFLNSQSNDLSTYGTNPLWQTVDGPYKITSYDVSTGANTLTANDSYSLTKPHITNIDDVAFTSISSEFDQLLTGKLDVGFVDFSDLPQVPKLKADGYNVWGAPDFGFEYMAYNFKDKTGDWDKIVSQLYVRQAIAHLQDEPGLISSKGGFDGAGGPAYGSVPEVPVSPYAPKIALSNPYPYSISAASSLLSSHGWKVKPNGQTVCEKAGTGAGECGAGIPKGTPLKFNVIYGNSPPVIGAEMEQLASSAKQVGINISLSSKTFNYITQNLSDVSNPSNDNLWGAEDFGGFTNDLYPTTNELFNTTGSFNQGGFSNPQVDKDILNSSYSLNPNAVKTELALITKEQPGLFQPNPDLVFAFKKTLQGPAQYFEDASQYQYSPEYWYFTK